MKILVCGGRDFNDQSLLDQTLDDLHARHPISQVIDGCARGADDLAHKWASKRGIFTRRFPADWRKHGRAAGHIRNTQMLREGKPDMVVAFPGGRGTQNMVEQAKKMGISCHLLKPGGY